MIYVCVTVRGDRTQEGRKEEQQLNRQPAGYETCTEKNRKSVKCSENDLGRNGVIIQ